jgi:hypothetical protein
VALGPSPASASRPGQAVSPGQRRGRRSSGCRALRQVVIGRLGRRQGQVVPARALANGPGPSPCPFHAQKMFTPGPRPATAPDTASIWSSWGGAYDWPRPVRPPVTAWSGQARADQTGVAVWDWAMGAEIAQACVGLYGKALLAGQDGTEARAGSCPVRWPGPAVLFTRRRC